MVTDQAWFEMPEVRRRRLQDSVWIPLRAVQHLTERGRSGYAGYKCEFFGVGTVAFHVEDKPLAETLTWHDVGISHNHSECTENGEYVPADVYRDHREKMSGLHLVLDQHFNSVDASEWHLHQDLVVALGLKREGDAWARPNEGYAEVARLARKGDGTPCLLEIRASHLRDYLCARDMSQCSLSPTLKAGARANRPSQIAVDGFGSVQK